VADYAKNPNALGALIGAVMRMSKGTANNQVVRETLIRRLATPE
jgi:Asp-tRNA(Asn)/Glu-tRNA(Gln) amidotransferase B subunit